MGILGAAKCVVPPSFVIQLILQYEAIELVRDVWIDKNISKSFRLFVLYYSNTLFRLY